MKSRKNKKMLVAVAMVLMIALVAGMGAMTYSRYITSGNTGPQTATAAKWGFVVTVNADELFGTQYQYDSGTTATVDGSGDVVVKAISSAKVVAPGTSGSMTINISGSAEVRAQLTIAQAAGSTIKEIVYDYADDAKTDYYPVKWTLKEGSSVIASGKLSEVIGTLTGTSTVLEPSATPYNKNYTLSWEWVFENPEDGLNGENMDVEDSLIGFKANGTPWNDVADPAQKGINGTYVGNYQIGTSNTEAEYGNIKYEVSFNLVVSVEQVQETA